MPEINTVTTAEQLADSSNERLEAIRNELIILYNKCLIVEAGRFDSIGAASLLSTIGWLETKIKAKTYV